jgi:fatty acid elongase 3
MDKFPLPTVDRPFGIALWPLFDKLYEKVVGTPASQFDFIPGETSLSTIPEVAGAIAAYYITIFAGYHIMKNQPALKLNYLFMAHNIILTIISGGLLALFIEQMFPILWRHGVFYSVCSSNCWTQPIVTLYYVCPRRAHLTSS